MRLTSLHPIRYGPFGGTSTELKIERGITVLTGANDTGKSAILRLLQFFCTREHGLDQTKLSELTNLSDATAPKRNDSDFVGFEAVFDGTTAGQKIQGAFAPGSQVHVRCSLRPASAEAHITRIVTGTTTSDPNQTLGPRPALVSLPYERELSDVLSLGNPSLTERLLLNRLLGQQFAAELRGAAPGRQSVILERAARDLNKEMETLLPPSGRLAVNFRGGSDSLAISISDHQGEVTPVTYRGGGVRRLLGHLIGLLEAKHAAVPCLVLFDEPETGLHADLQHYLRRAMERLCDANENVQIIYATHSPCMINNLHPEAVRVFSKASSDGKTSIRIRNTPIDENWLVVRQSLGLTASDSLLYGQVTVIVEGMTEVLTIQRIVAILEREGTPGFKGALQLFEAVHLLPGGGDSYSFFATLAKSQGNRVIVFLDADKRNQEAALRKKHPDVPVIILSGRKEIEDLVVRERYFEALRRLGKSTATHPERYTPASFDSWWAGAAHPEQMLFSKRVEKWFESMGESLSKPEAMLEAVRSATAADLAEAIPPLTELLTRIREALEAEPS